jgi:DNA-binding MarR family transcriptional regulator
MYNFSGMKKPPPTIPSDGPDGPLTGEFMETWWRLGQAMKREIVPILEQHHGADFFDFMVMNCIDEGNIYPGQIAETCVVQASKISRVLDDLTKRGLVQRTIDPIDSRRIRLELTPEGMKVLGEVHQTVGHLLAPAFTEIGKPEVQRIIRTVQHITDTVSNHAQARKPQEVS